MAPPPSLVFGPIMIGVVLNALFQGVFMLQALIYYQTYTRDKAWIRYFVLYVFVVECANTLCAFFEIYQPLIMLFDQPAALEYLPKTLAGQPMTTVLISTPIQIFTSWRINVIVKQKWPCIFITLCSLSATASAAWTSSIIVTDNTFETGLPATRLPAAVWLVSSAVADMSITALLLYGLYMRKSNFKSTNTAINRVIRITVQTGVITLIFAIADVLSFMLSPDTSLNFAWDFALPKLYSNAFLSALNARQGWNQLAGNDQGIFDNLLFGSDAGRSRASQIKRTEQTGPYASFVDTESRNFIKSAQGGIQGYELPSITTPVQVAISQQIQVARD